MWKILLVSTICYVVVVIDAAVPTSQKCPCPRYDLNGKLVKTSDSPSVYLIIDGHRRGIPNPETYNNLFRDWKDITIMAIDSIPLGPGITDGAVLAKSSDNDDVYLISNGVKRHIISPPVFTAHHFNSAKIEIVPKVVLDSIPKGDNIGNEVVEVPCDCPRNDLNGQLVKSPDSTSVYLVLDGLRRGIPNENTYNNLFRDWKDITIMDVNQIPLGPNLSDMATLVKSKANASVYLVSNGVKRGITSEQAFNKYHFGWDKIVVIPQITVDTIPEGGLIS